MMTAFSPLLQNRAQGFFFLHKALEDFTTDIGLEKIERRARRVYEDYILSTKKSHITPEFKFVLDKENDDRLCMLIQEPVTAVITAGTIIGRIDLKSMKEGLELEVTGWKFIKKIIHKDIGIAELKSKVELLGDALDRAEQRLIKELIESYRKFSSDKPQDFSFALLLEDDGLRIIVYRHQKEFSNHMLFLQ